MKTKLLLILLVFSTILATHGQGTAFTYQGRLNDGTNPASGIYDLRFAIYDSASTGTLIAGPLTNSATGLTNGLFTVTLDFGGIFTGTNYWLDIGVRTNAAGSFTALSPRQPTSPTPYAIFANTAGNLTGSGANLTSLNDNNISTGTLSDTRLSANVALRSGGNTFTNTQTFNSAILLNTSDGFDQSSVGNFLIDAPFLPGGRFAVLANGNVGIGNPSPGYTLDVGGDMSLPLPATIFAAGNPIFRVDANANAFVGTFAGNLTLSGSGNVGSGYGALYLDTLGSLNTASGYGALNVNANGSYNTAVGAYALASNTSGINNTATGYQSLFANTVGTNDVADGSGALYSNTVGYRNTAVGFQALSSNTVGNANTAVGEEALLANTRGSANTASGSYALRFNTNGMNNTADGYQALGYNTNGDGNTAVGYSALIDNAYGSDNTAVGEYSLSANTSGSENTAVGHNALFNLISGFGNIALGLGAGSSITGGSNNIVIGNNGTSSDNNVIRIGTLGTQTNTFIAGIFGTPVSGSSVTVNSAGQLGVLPSSQRFKQNIHAMADASDVLLALQPVTFQYKPDIDPRGLSQFGLIAEQVEKVDPDLVVHDQQHGVFTVRYEAVNAMLLNEFLKQHKTVVEQNAEIQRLNEKMETGSQNSENRMQKLESENAELKQRLAALERLIPPQDEAERMPDERQQRN
jgi:hypothetical protein